MAKFWRKHHPLTSTSRLGDLKEPFLASVKARLGETAHYEDLESRVGILLETFASRLPNTVTRPDGLKWLQLPGPGRWSS